MIGGVIVTVAVAVFAVVALVLVLDVVADVRRLRRDRDAYRAELDASRRRLFDELDRHRDGAS